MLIHNTTHAATMFFKPMARLVGPSVLSLQNNFGPFVRPLSSTISHPKKHDYTQTEPGSYMTKEPHSRSPNSEGRYARTDESVRIPYPGDEHIPHHIPVFPGHGRSLAGFSLENKVSVVTGGCSWSGSRHVSSDYWIRLWPCYCGSLRYDEAIPSSPEGREQLIDDMNRRGDGSGAGQQLDGAI